MTGKPLTSLAIKLIVFVGLFLILGGIIFGFIFIRYEEDIMTGNMITYASSTADLVKRSLYYSMLTAHREALQQTIEVISAGSDIKRIAIFDKKGTIVYSSRKDEVGTVVGQDAATCRICHRGDGKPLETIPGGGNWLFVRDPAGEKLLSLVAPLSNEPSCSAAACHFHQGDRKIIGVLETTLSTAPVDAVIRKNRIGTLLYGGLFILTVSVCLSAVFYKLVSIPLTRLEEGMRRIARGDLDQEIEIRSGDEMELLARTFNSMTADVKKYRENMEHWTKALEEEIQKKTAEIMKAHDQLINTEKLASLGRMAAGVAHELNSPLTGIVTFAHLMMKRIPPGNKQDVEDVEVIIEQAERCAKIIKGLLGFSRKTSAEKARVSINTLLENTLTMLRNQAKFHNIKFVLNLDGGLPEVSVDPNQVQQVFLNLLINAADAIEGRGQVTIATRISGEPSAESTPWLKQGYPPETKKYIEVEFTDTGPGIPEDHLGKIFEPFFTTKPVGKGTGLGLAVSYGIIKRHGGNIFVRSEVGKGASFFVRLPVEES